MTAAAEMLGAFWERQESLKAAKAMIATTETALRHQRALVTSSRALLALPDEQEALHVALSALTEATEADYGFVERNEEVDGVGLCSRTVHEVDRTKSALEVDPVWELVPWSKMPDSYSMLSMGLPFAFHLDDLGPIERRLYESDPYPTASEIDIPILVDGSWEGLVGFSHESATREWTEQEKELLTTVADMIGAHWARQRTQEKLAELLVAKDTFLASVSHELRTPLTAIVGLSSELHDFPDRFEPEMARELIAVIARQSSDLSNIIEDLLVAARVDKEIHTSPSHVDVGLEVARVIEALGMGAVEPVGTAVAWADPVRVRQIMRNLLTNTKRHGGPNVEMEISSLQDRVVVRVIDDGDGVDESRVDALFEPYQIGQQEPSQPDSIGLGLAISARLAMLMGGDLRYSREGDHTVFALALPRQP